ncbi:MAG: membrane protein insertion efficiency factor YidD [Acidobacteria bacterium 13_1_40CM_56_16]|nr:MAG: membrane protein insertion efficiency factor YidD [Acidobacteria bacterium 13_1_40CM_56_16]
MVPILALKLVRVYKLIVSPWLPAACRFTPTCSEYASDAIKEFGLVRGGVRSAGRLLRCHPLHRGGFDPVR